MPVWKFISKLEIHDRQVHSSPDGMEVINTYYVEPASAGCVVTSALLGAVLFDGGVDASGTPNYPTQGHRILPATDYQYQNCYCVDANETMTHPMQTIGTASLLGANTINSTTEWDAIRTMLVAPIVLNGPDSLQSKDGIGDFALNSIDPTQGPRPGIYIRAVFRPLISSYKWGNDIDDTSSADDLVSFAFDYVDLRLNPMSRIIPASAALYGALNAGMGFGIAAQGAAEQVDSWLQITIRRVMCPNIPIQTIAVLKNKINGLPYTPACFEVPGLNLNVPDVVNDTNNPTESLIQGLNPTSQTFPIQTLRFDDAVWEKKVIQSCIDQNKSDFTNNDIVILTDSNGVPMTQPMTWWNGELMFSWRTVMDNWYSVSFIPGEATPRNTPSYGWVSWNCDWLPGGMGVIAFNGFPLRRYPSGWYELGSWQSVAIHGDLQLFDFGVLAPILGNLYLQRKYWNDNDIRLRGGNASGWNHALGAWNVPGAVNSASDLLPLLTELNGPLPLTVCLPFDLLFRINAP